MGLKFFYKFQFLMQGMAL